jgi:hypothetical protein
MTLRTVRYDDSIYKVVPKKPTINMLDELTNGDDKKISLMKLRYSNMIAAAPEYPDHIGIRAIIADDAYAITFQTMGQYRTALLKAMSSPPEDDK